MMVESVAHGRFLREQLEFGEAELLRRRGWAHGCSGPGSFWHWSKRIEGEHFQCGQSMALALEGALEFVDDDGDALHDLAYQEEIEIREALAAKIKRGDIEAVEDPLNRDMPSGSKFKIGGTDGD